MNKIRTHRDLQVYQLAFDKYDHILSQLVIMINSPEKWSH